MEEFEKLISDLWNSSPLTPDEKLYVIKHFYGLVQFKMQLAEKDQKILEILKKESEVKDSE